jgi:hypothetical protein
MTFDEAVTLVNQCKSRDELFHGTEVHQNKQFKDLAKLLHPDLVRGKEKKERAEKVFKKMNEWYTKTAKPAKDLITLGNWEVIRPLGKGDIADVYVTQAAPGIKAVNMAMKIVRDIQDNDLMKNERAHLKSLWKGKHNYTKYLPKLVDHFKASDRDVHVLNLAENCWSLTEIKQLMGDLDFRHGVWMMNRLLSILGYAHTEGYVHGAITPDHLMYRPADHGLILIDWTCSLRAGDHHVPLMVDRWKANYPQEVVRKRPAYPSTDLFMAAEAINWAVGGNRPKAFKQLFDHCWAGSPASRPSNTWVFQDKWVKAAEKEYGPAKFLPLNLPTI